MSKERPLNLPDLDIVLESNSNLKGNTISSMASSGKDWMPGFIKTTNPRVKLKNYIEFMIGMCLDPIPRKLNDS